MKKLSRVFLSLLSIAALAGCVPPGPGPGPNPDYCAEHPEDEICKEPVTGEKAINFMYYNPSSQADQEAFNQLLKDFTAETGIKVTSNPVTKDSYDSTLRSAITRGRNKPDLAYLDQPLIARYAKDEMITPIDNLLVANDISKDIFNSTVWETNIYNGKTYGVPLNMTASVLFYNKSLINASSITTWDQWKNATVPANKALFEGIGSEGYAGWYFQAFLANNGGTLYNPTTNKVAFNSAEGIEAAQFIKDLYRTSTDHNVRSGSDAFLNGNILFKVGSSYDIDNIRKLKPQFDLGAIVMPSKNGVNHFSCIGGENLVLPRHADTTAAKQTYAMQLMKYLLRKDSMQQLSRYTGNFPAITEYVETTDTVKQVVLTQLATVVARPVVPSWLTVNDLYLGAAMDKILHPETPESITSALAWAETAANTELARP